MNPKMCVFSEFHLFQLNQQAITRKFDEKFRVSYYYPSWPWVTLEVKNVKVAQFSPTTQGFYSSKSIAGINFVPFWPHTSLSSRRETPPFMRSTRSISLEFEEEETESSSPSLSSDTELGDPIVVDPCDPFIFFVSRRVSFLGASPSKLCLTKKLFFFVSSVLMIVIFQVRLSKCWSSSLAKFNNSCLICFILASESSKTSFFLLIIVSNPKVALTLMNSWLQGLLILKVTSSFVLSIS